MTYVMFKKEKWVFLGLFFKKRYAQPFTGDKMAMLMSDPADVNSKDIDENSDFVAKSVVRLVKLGDCTPVYDKDSGEFAFVESPNHRHLCFMVMDKVDLSPRTRVMSLDVKIISEPPLAARGAADEAATSPTALPTAQPPGVRSGRLRKAIQQTTAAKDAPLQPPAAKPVRQKRTQSKAAAGKPASKAASVKQPKKRAVAGAAKGGSGRPPRGAKGRSTAEASPLSVDEDTHFDVEPEQDSIVAQALGPLASGRGRSVSHVTPPVVETPRIDDQSLMAKQIADMSKILTGLQSALTVVVTAQQALSHVPMPQGKKRGLPEQGEGTPPSSPPNSGHLPRSQRPESDFSAAVVSPNTERLQGLANVEDRYNDRVRSLGRQPRELNGSSRWRAIAPYAREQMIGGSVADAEPDARERANNDLENRGYRHLPPYTATRRPSNDPVPTVVNNYHYHGDSGHSRPSLGPPALQASAQPRGRFTNVPIPFQGRRQMHMLNAGTYGLHDADGHYYDDGYPEYSR